METTRIELTGIEEIEADREMVDGVITLTLTTEAKETVEITCGRFYDDAIALRDLLQEAANDIDRSIVKCWEDVPDPDADAFIGEDRGRYYVQVEGVSIEGDRPRGFRTQTIAEIALAEWMAKYGVFPNCWFENERGNTFDINETIRKYHDAGGDKMLPLEGVDYKEGADIQARIYVARKEYWEPAYVVRDYGADAGLIYIYSGDDTEHWTDDRDEVRPAPEDEDE